MDAGDDPNAEAELTSRPAERRGGGGTSLSRTATGTGRGWTESARADAGADAARIAKPAWQHDADCPGRMTADISADADPDTGLAVHDTYDRSGRLDSGGTSTSAPFLAGVIGLAGHPGRFADASRLHARAGSLFDVVGGGDDRPGGAACGGYQCVAVPGYDGPTGDGTPDGLGAF